MFRTYLILSFSGYFSLIVVKVGTHQATSSCNTLRRHVALCILENFCQNLCLRNRILSGQQVAKSKKSDWICATCWGDKILLLRQRFAHELTRRSTHRAICHWDLSRNLLQQFIARPVHTEWFIAAKCCSDMSPSVYVFTRHRTNFRPAEIFDQTLGSHGTVQDFGFVHTEFWTAKRLNFRTVKVVQCELNTKTHQF